MAKQKRTKTKAKQGAPRQPAPEAAPVKRGRRKATEAKLENLLATAAELMAQKGYDNMSIRDVARATGYSLAGMYYYFDSKEQLLFQIQRNTFESLVTEQEAAVQRAKSAKAKLEALVRNYLDFFLRHTNELKVCAFEHESLKDAAYEEVRDIRHRWYRLLAGIVADLTGLDPAADDASIRHYTLFIFGMLNWIFMWFDERRDTPIETLGDEMIHMIFHGLPRQTKNKKG